MAISILKNQPITFHLPDEVDCDCVATAFCQIIDPTDPTQFQLVSTDTVVNGDFSAGLEGWNVVESLIINVLVTNETEVGECDGFFVVDVENGTPAFLYSIDGGEPTGSNIFTGLCEGCYTLTVVDSLGNQGSTEVCIAVNACDAGTNTLDLLPYKTIDIRNCNTLDFI